MNAQAIADIRANAEEIIAALSGMEDDKTEPPDAGEWVTDESPAESVGRWLDRQKLLGMVSRDVELVERLIEDIR